MTPSEKVAYLRGLAEGLGVEESSREGKLLNAIIDVLTDMAHGLDEVNEKVDSVGEDIDELYDEMDELSQYFTVEDDEDDEEDDYWDDGEPVFYEVTCPACENTITIDEDVLLTGAISCPNCGETLEFDFDSIEDIDDDADGSEED